MLLAVDVGNTQTVLGLFQGRELSWHWRIATQSERTADELALMFGGFLEQQDLSFSRQITGVCIASVVPDQTRALREMVHQYFHFEPVVLEPGVRTGIPILTDNPKEVGADRIANALAAAEEFGGPAVVVDFGTATTYDAVSERGEYLGGAIAPGVQVSAAALFASTSRLLRVELEEPRSVRAERSGRRVIVAVLERGHDVADDLGVLHQRFRRHQQIEPTKERPKDRGRCAHRRQKAVAEDGLHEGARVFGRKLLVHGAGLGVLQHR